MDRRRLALDPFRKKLGGVCAGFARYLSVEPLIVRLLAICGLFVAPQATLLAYGIAYLVLDNEDIEDI
jgi:phage shock protein PspC (stress-responsive transcriptional regulator)